jgi:alpha-1,3-glucosyltransferase
MLRAYVIRISLSCAQGMASSHSLPRIIACIFMYAVLLFGPKIFLWNIAVHHGQCVPNPHRRLINASETAVVDCYRVPVGECCGTAYSMCSFQPGLYHSSDFEVHRNWLSIVSERRYSWLRSPGNGSSTLNLLKSLRYWYRENSSLWTLDYPPLFAWYEFAISQVLLLMDHPVVSKIFFTHPSVCSARSSVDLFDLRNAAGQSSTTTDSEPLAIPLHSSQGIVAFQRATVIIFSDVPYFIATVVLFVTGYYARNIETAAVPSTLQLMLPLVAACCPAWTIVDNIHFQYNGIIFAVFMLSIYLAYCNRPYSAAMCYGVLVFLKHMMAYFALGYAVWGVAVVICGGCCNSTSVGAGAVRTPAPPTHRRKGAASANVMLAALAQFIGALALVMVIVIGPFAASEYVSSDARSSRGLSYAALVVESTVAAVLPIKERLFPFGRGLVHAYWAPNVYALYSTADFALCKALPVLNKHLPPMVTFVLQGVFPNALRWCGKTSVNTKGLVGLEASGVAGGVAELMKAPTHAALPSLTPLTSNVLVLGCFVCGVVWLVLVRGRSAPYLRTFAWWASPEGLLWGTFWSACSFFLFSWHVHEKAILSVVLPVLVYVLRRSPMHCDTSSSSALHLCFRLNVIATATVFPLLFSPLENAIKYALFGMFAVVPYVVVFSALGHPRRTIHIATMIAAGGLSFASLWVDETKMTTFAPLMLMSFLGALAVHVTIFVPFFWQ